MNNFEWDYVIRIEASRNLNDAERNFLESALGYLAASAVRGEAPTFTWHDDARVTVYLDSTKSRRDDVGDAYHEFLVGIQDILTEGSPVRKTDRSGPGTKGTRLINSLESFNDVGLKFTSDSEDYAGPVFFREEQYRLRTLTVPQPEENTSWILSIERITSDDTITSEFIFEDEARARTAYNELLEAVRVGMDNFILSNKENTEFSVIRLTCPLVLTFEVELRPA